MSSGGVRMITFGIDGSGRGVGMDRSPWEEVPLPLRRLRCLRAGGTWRSSGGVRMAPFGIDGSCGTPGMDQSPWEGGPWTLHRLRWPKDVTPAKPTADYGPLAGCGLRPLAATVFAKHLVCTSVPGAGGGKSPGLCAGCGVLGRRAHPGLLAGCGRHPLAYGFFGVDVA